jgi:hypothetical protein
MIAVRGEDGGVPLRRSSVAFNRASRAQLASSARNVGTCLVIEADGKAGPHQEISLPHGRL